MSILSLRAAPASRSSQGNANVAARAVEEIRRYITTNAELLKALAANLQDTGLTPGPAGPHHQELRPRHPPIPRDHPLRRGRRRGGDEPHRQAARRDPEERARSSSTACRCRGSASTKTCCRPRVFAIHLTQARRAGRLARRPVQPRRNVADGRSHPDRRARLRAGRSPRTAS